MTRNYLISGLDSESGDYEPCPVIASSSSFCVKFSNVRVGEEQEELDSTAAGGDLATNRPISDAFLPFDGNVQEPDDELDLRADSDEDQDEGDWRPISDNFLLVMPSEDEDSDDPDDSNAEDQDHQEGRDEGGPEDEADDHAEAALRGIESESAGKDIGVIFTEVSKRFVEWRSTYQTSHVAATDLFNYFKLVRAIGTFWVG